MHLLKNNRNGKPGIPTTEVECFYNDDVLVFNFVAYDSTLESFSNRNNDEIWRGNVVEVFLDVGELEYYYEFEVAPNGTIFVAQKYKDKLIFVNNNFFNAKVEKRGNSYVARMEIETRKIAKTNNLLFNAFRCEGDSLEALSPTFSDTFHKKEYFVSVKDYVR
ncbi:MAG: hypothetical protein IKP50_01475 [Bacilli bacterium]|nr:hypothetical protein [Bacilli bacterium]